MKHLLPQKPFFKANLHTHSTISDGDLTPEEVKAVYQSRGYSILAITDHSVMIPHNDLTDPDFLMITGTEIDFPLSGSTKTCHLCMLSRDPQLQWIPFLDPDPLERMRPYMELCECDDLPYKYCPENINRVIARANEKGLLVTYNHPAWSKEYYEDYSHYEGLWAIEHRNSACISIGCDENNGWIYREFIHMGKPLVPVMADDMHTVLHKKNGYPVAGMSWTMVAADTLEYGCVMNALARGDLYSSCGPELYSITWDDGILQVKCSPAARIQLIKHRRRDNFVWGEGITEAAFSMEKWYELSADDPSAWFYLIVTAADGTYAVTPVYTPAHLAE